MKKVLFSIVVLLVILHSKTTFVQDGRSFHQSEFTQQACTPLHVNTQSDGFDLDDHVIDFTDDNVNDRERKYFSFQNVALTTIYFVARPIYSHFFESNRVTLNNIAFQSALFILNRAFRI
jgi:hypothetical protein